MNLLHIRQEIDAIDRSLLQLLRRRFLLVSQTTGYKKQVIDAKREAELRVLWSEEARQSGLSEEFALRLLDEVLTESHRIQKAA